MIERDMNKTPVVGKVNYFKSVYKRSTFGVPRTPSRWISKEMNYIPITRIGMSCGGGIGGSQWFEYVERIELSVLETYPSSLITVTTLDGKEKLINRDYVVDAEQFTVGWMLLNSQNPNFKKGNWLYRILLEDGQKVELDDEFMSTGDLG